MSTFSALTLLVGSFDP